MRSGTSFFNCTLYRKNMTRFWPIWAVYTLIWAFLMPLQFLTLPAQYAGASGALADRLARQANQVCELLSVGSMMAFCAGAVAAMAVFSYLCFNRSACMMHSLPMDRNSLFFTNYLSGLSFLLLPNAAVFLMTLAVELLYGCVNFSTLLTWLLVQSGTCFFFYSFAVFCAMFTGNIFALPTFYGILNFLVVALVTLVDNVLGLFFYGYSGIETEMDSVVVWLTPLIKLNDACNTMRQVTTPDGVTTAWTTFQIREPEVVAIYAAVGLVLTVLALMVYRRRHVESAGDVVAIPIVRPVFRLGVAVCSGLSFGILSVAALGFANTELALGIAMVIWTIIGYFVAEMLLRKSFRVLNAWKGAVAVAAVMLVLFTAVAKDWFGYENRVPAAGEVESIYISSVTLGAPYDDGRRGYNLTVENEKQIGEIRNLHQAIVGEKDRNDPGDDYISLDVEYTLKDGTILSRHYHSVPVYLDETQTMGSVTNAAYTLIHDRDFIREAYKFDQPRENWRLVEAYLSNLWSEKYQDLDYQPHYLDGAAGEDLENLWQAVLADFEEGTIGVRYLFDSSQERRDNTYTTDLTFTWERTAQRGASVTSVPLDYDYSYNTESLVETYQTHITITLTPNARNTLAWLEDMGTDTDQLLTYTELDALEHP